MESKINSIITSIMDTRDAINDLEGEALALTKTDGEGEDSMEGSFSEGPLQNLQLSVKYLHYAIEHLRRARSGLKK